MLGGDGPQRKVIMFGFKSIGTSIGEAAGIAAIKTYREGLERIGLAIVPVEPTPKMLAAGESAVNAAECYRRMVDAGRIRH
jgi:hypothetical protein